MKKLAVPLAVSLSLSIFSAPAFAKSTIGGIVFLNTYLDQFEDTNNSANDVDNIILANAGNSRFRVKWTNEDRVTMYQEIALKNGGLTVRHAYGKWDFSETGQVLGGQTSTPFAPLNATVAMVHNSGQGYGRTSPGRVSQMRYTYKFLNRHGAIAAALVDPNKGKNATAGGTELTRENSLPRIDVGMAYRTFNFQIFPSFFVHQMDFKNGDSLTANGISLGLKTGTGPLTFTAEFGTGQNWGNTAGSYSGSTAGNNAFATYGAAGNKEDDSDNTSFFFDVGYRFTGTETKGAMHFVFGSMTSESTGTTTSVDATSTMIGISMPIDLPYIARGFRIRPELFIFDDEDTGTNSVDTTDTIIGVQLQYTF